MKYSGNRRSQEPGRDLVSTYSLGNFTEFFFSLPAVGKKIEFLPISWVFLAGECSDVSTRQVSPWVAARLAAYLPLFLCSHPPQPPRHLYNEPASRYLPEEEAWVGSTGAAARLASSINRRRRYWLTLSRWLEEAEGGIVASNESFRNAALLVLQEVCQRSNFRLK